MRDVKLYSRKWCGWCIEAKDYLQAHGIPFREIDVGRDTAADEEMQRLSGQSYVPTKCSSPLHSPALQCLLVLNP